MAGLLAVAGFAVYVWFFWFLCRQSFSWKARISVFAIAISVPLIEVPFGLWSFYSHCAAEGGTQVDARFGRPDSILIESRFVDRPQDLLKFGFKVVEVMSKGQVIRYTIHSGQFTTTIEPAPISRFKYEYSGPTLGPGKLVRTDETLIDIQSGKVVARQSDFDWMGTWWEIATGIFVFRQSHCPNFSQKPLYASLFISL